jgi:hypothetical protein
MVGVGFGFRDEDRVVNNCMLSCVNIGLAFMYALQVVVCDGLHDSPEMIDCVMICVTKF